MFHIGVEAAGVGPRRGGLGVARPPNFRIHEKSVFQGTHFLSASLNGHQPLGPWPPEELC